MESSTKDENLDQKKSKKGFLSAKTLRTLDRLFIPLMGATALVCITIIAFMRLSQYDQEIPQHLKEFYIHQNALNKSKASLENTNQFEEFS